MQYKGTGAALNIGAAGPRSFNKHTYRPRHHTQRETEHGERTPTDT